MRKRLINIDELAEMLSVKKATIYWWIRGNQIPHLKLGRLVRFDPERIDEWLQNKTMKSRDPLTNF